MFERQIRLSRYDPDKLLNSSTPASSRMGSQHREFPSPTRSRSASPNDMAHRQRRSLVSAPTISLPVPTSYPDVVISHTPPAEATKTSVEQIHHDNLLINNPGMNKDKKLFLPNRPSSISHDHSPLCVIVDDSSSNTSNHQRPNLLLPSISSSETVDCQPLDFKSRLALFNRTNTQPTNENLPNTKKTLNPVPIKPVVHQSARIIQEEKKEILSETTHSVLPIPISRSVVNTAKAVTFFGGDKLNENNKSFLPKSIAPPPPPLMQKTESASTSKSIDSVRTPAFLGGNVKLNKSSIFSGAKKV